MVNAISTHFTIERTMSFILQPWQFFIVILVGWVNREQQRSSSSTKHKSKP